MMTWGDFKKLVEAAGVNDETELDYIDWASYGETVTVRHCHNGTNIVDFAETGYHCGDFW